MLQRIILIIGCLMLIPGVSGRDAHSQTLSDRVTDIADRYYEARMQRIPELGYFVGLPSEHHDQLYDNSLTAVQRWQQTEDQLLAELASIPEQALRGSPAWVTHGIVSEQLEAAVQSRICRAELWNVNQMGGWHQQYVRVASLQPVASAAQREQALKRWGRFPQFIENEISNLQQGQAAGYSSPRPVVELVLHQLDGLLAQSGASSPLASPAVRSEDDTFKSAFIALVDEQILPAMHRYRDFLKQDYLPRARTQLSVYANPDGQACYAASLRSYTTLKRSPEAVFELGKQTVDGHRASVTQLGEQMYELTDFEAIVARVSDDPNNKFSSKDQLLAYSRDMVARTRDAMDDWFRNVPDAAIVVEPYPEFLDGTGVSSRYEAPRGEQPGTYRITLHQPQAQTLGGAEITAVHEAWPGHHLQIAIAQNLPGTHKVGRIIFNSGFTEGWARYAEALAEEMGLYQARAALITRRAWPARGMVVDPGIHVMGWDVDQAKAFLRESGRFEGSRADDMIKRIAILPGQLTAYDSGALEFFALRELAEQRLGDRFDIKEFHEKVLENGTITLPMLRTHIEAWLDSHAGGSS